MNVEKKCMCAVCQYHAEFLRHLGAISDKNSRVFFERMYERLCGVEMDNEVNRAMMDGSWPSGKLVFVPNCEGLVKHTQEAGV